MKKTYDDLVIIAHLEYLRPVPRYLEVDCALTVRAFVDGAYPVEQELRALEAFRKAVVRLTEEGLSRSPDCGPCMAPSVKLKLTGGEDNQDPDLEFHADLGLEHWGDLDFWVLHWRNEAGDYISPMFLDAGRALSFLKCLLDKKTGEWASRVSFEADRVDS
ncbi:MAG: hypothetical protein HYV14_12755 [Elusimicrobia bacterium]|nr:hypothetical protein [Elusimicrobiota bacterium]